MEETKVDTVEIKDMEATRVAITQISSALGLITIRVVNNNKVDILELTMLKGEDLAQVVEVMEVTRVTTKDLLPVDMDNHKEAMVAMGNHREATVALKAEQWTMTMTTRPHETLIII